MRTVASSTLLLFFAVSPLSSQEDARSVAPLPASQTSAVYAKVILPVKALPDGNQPVVESWISRKLRKHGATDFRAVTGWVRLPDSGDSTNIWEATLDGELSGCRVDGQVEERTADGKVHVTLSGWSPFGANVRGNSLPDEIGSRGVAIVDPGRADEVKSYVALMIAPAPNKKNGEQDGARQPATAPDSKSEGNRKLKPESEVRPRDSKVVFLHLFSNRYDINSMGKLPPPPRDWQCIATVTIVSGYPFYFDIPCHNEPQMRIEGNVVRSGKRVDPDFTISVEDVGPAYRHTQKTAIDLGTLHDFGDSGFKFSISASQRPPRIGAKD